MTYVVGLGVELVDGEICTLDVTLGVGVTSLFVLKGGTTSQGTLGPKMTKEKEERKINIVKKISNFIGLKNCFPFFLPFLGNVIFLRFTMIPPFSKLPFNDFFYWKNQA